MGITTLTPGLPRAEIVMHYAMRLTHYNTTGEPNDTQELHPPVWVTAPSLLTPTSPKVSMTCRLLPGAWITRANREAMSLLRWDTAAAVRPKYIQFSSALGDRYDRFFSLNEPDLPDEVRIAVMRTNMEN